MILYLIGQLWCYPGQEVDVFVCMKPRHLICRRTFGPLYEMRGTVKQDELIDRTANAITDRHVHLVQHIVRRHEFVRHIHSVRLHWVRCSIGVAPDVG